MFKPISRFIHRMPWWGLLLAGASVLLLLVLFTVPLQVLQLTERDAPVAEKRAVKREIEQAVRDSGLSVAQLVLGRVRQRAEDPQRQRELDRVLQEISRARGEGVRDSVRQAAHDAARDALETAEDAAQTELDAAQDALETARTARAEGLEGLREKGLDVRAAEKSFDDIVRAAEAKLAAKQTALDGVREAMERLGPLPPEAAASAPEATASVPAVVELSPALRDSIRQRVQSDMWRAGIGSVLILIFIPLFVVLLVAKYFIDRSHNAEAYARKQEEEAQLSHLQRQMTEARLQALQAQVEPHFLYNTLANVQALTEIDPPAANTLVGHLIDYLRAALPKMRQSSSTVGQELDRARAYLNILKMRMGERLSFDIVCEDALRDLPFPPMMLPTLVENAIKHGLEPKREGGHIAIEVGRTQADEEDRLQLKVRDNGAGLSEQETQGGTGVGLSNLRERLLGLFAGRARFELHANEQGGGVEAVIDLPVAALHRSESALTGTATTASITTGPVGPLSVWQRFWGVTRRTHSLWALVLSRTFVVLMAVLLVLFFVVQIGVLSGLAPVVVDNLQIDGVEGKAIGSLGLFVAFGVVALVLSLLLLLLYGLGFLFVGVLVFVIGAVLLGLSPVLAPMVLVGLVVFWLWRNHRRRVEARIRLREQQRQS